MGAIVNPANAVTASRYLTLPAFYYFYEHGSIQLATAMLILCGVIDLFDGAVARLFKCTSGFGELFDAITDGICYAFFIIVGVIHGAVSWVPVTIVLGLGALNSLFRGIYARRAGRATNYRSYAMERCVGYIAYMAGSIIVGFETEYYVWMSALWMVVIMAHDTKRMLIDPVPA